MYALEKHAHITPVFHISAEMVMCLATIVGLFET